MVSSHTWTWGGHSSPKAASFCRCCSRPAPMTSALWWKRPNEPCKCWLRAWIHRSCSIASCPTLLTAIPRQAMLNRCRCRPQSPLLAQLMCINALAMLLFAECSSCKLQAVQHSCSAADDALPHQHASDRSAAAVISLMNFRASESRASEFQGFRISGLQNPCLLDARNRKGLISLKSPSCSRC